MLREQTTTPPPAGDHTPNVEIMQKELAAHKEMVAELRGQLKEREEELQVGTATLVLVLGWASIKMLAGIEFKGRDKV